MSIEKMTLVQITGSREALDPVLSVCAKTDYLHLEQPVRLAEKVGGFAPLNEENPYKNYLSQMQGIAGMAGISLSADSAGDIDFSAESMDAYLKEVREKITSLAEKKANLEKFRENRETSLKLLERFNDLGTSLDDIFACKYLKVRFGRLPADSYEKLSYYADRLFLFVSISEDNDYHWGVCFTSEDEQTETDDILSSLYFERLWIPDSLHGTPSTAHQMLEAELAANREELKKVDEELKKTVSENAGPFTSYYSKITRMSDAFDMRKYVGMSRDTFHITGFIPEREEKRFAGAFAEISGADVEFRPHDSDKRLVTPTKLKNNRFCRPFQMFVEMYGVPSYNEIDPTPFLAVTYTLLFGIMFGDLGQGLLIALLGFFLSKKSGSDFGKILIRIGCSSAVFGLLYGSVFGLEHLLDPLYHALGFAEKPIEVMNPGTINTLLIAALALGVILISASMVMNVVMGFKQRDFEKAIFSNNGIAGLVFYLAVLIGAASVLMGGPNLFTLPYILGLIVLPILVIFLKEPLGKLIRGSRRLKPEEGIGSFIIDSFFELFEVALEFVTNTMSFLRVGGFIISHAGMMSVVLTLAEMMSGTGNVFVMIFGNLFVVALEGFIVGIQGLRLQFYELFSHYFEGGGKAFVPATRRESSQP